MCEVVYGLVIQALLANLFYFQEATYWEDFEGVAIVNSISIYPLHALLLQNIPKFILRNSVICFFKIDKACKEIFAMLPRFLEDLLQSEELKIWSVELRTGRKPHWPSFSFDSTISRHFLSRHLAYIFPGKLRSDTPLQFIHCLQSSFLNIGIITPVCQFLGVLPNFHAA